MPAILRAALEHVAATIAPPIKGGAMVAGNGTRGDAVGKCLTVAGAGSNDLEVENLIACATGPRTHALTAEGFDASEDGTGRGTPIIAFHGSQDPDTPGGITHPIPAQSNGMATCIAIQERAICENPNAGPDGKGWRDDDRAYTLEARSVVQAVAFQVSQSGERISDARATLDANNGSRRHYGAVVLAPGGYAVRRLTPTECHRLQGFPDDHCAIEVRGKPAADGPQYKALGNSMAVPVMNWLIARASGRAPDLRPLPPTERPAP